MNIQAYLTEILKFLSDIIIPFLIGLAFLAFIWNAYRYFILGGTSEESQEKAKTFALWGIMAFVLIVSIWGIVNLLVEGFGFQNSSQAPGLDYMQMKTGTTNDMPNSPVP